MTAEADSRCSENSTFCLWTCMFICPTCCFFITTCIMSWFCATQCKWYKMLISGSLCKQAFSYYLTKCIWCLPARVKLWTLLKHFSLIMCIFKYYDLDSYCFCTLFFQLNIADNCTFTHFVNFVFFCNLDSFWNLYIFNWVSINNFFDVTRTEDKGVFSNPTVLFAELYFFNSLLQICQLYVD